MKMPFILFWFLTLLLVIYLLVNMAFSKCFFLFHCYSNVIALCTFINLIQLQVPAKQTECKYKDQWQDRTKSHIQPLALMQTPLLSVTNHKATANHFRVRQTYQVRSRLQLPSAASKSIFGFQAYRYLSVRFLHLCDYVCCNRSPVVWTITIEPSPLFFLACLRKKYNKNVIKIVRPKERCLLLCKAHVNATDVGTYYAK